MNSCQEKIDDIETAILERLILDPQITRKQLSALLNVSEQTIRYRLEKIQREGRIYHN